MGEWTTIKVPRELHSRIKFLSEKLGKPHWYVISEALSFYEESLRRPKVKQELSNLEKLSWYITKLATSFGAFKENPSDDNFHYLQKRIEELQQRIGVDASLLLRFAEYYRSTKDEEMRKKLRIDMNAAFKQVVKDLIIKMLFELITKGEE